MELLGNLIQEGIPTPENPVEIKHKYKIFYEADGEIIEREVDEKELQEFLGSLEPKNESSLKVKQVKEAER
jgi:hypothetical protein